MVAGRPLAPIGAAAIGAAAPRAALAPIASAGRPDEDEMSDFEQDGEEPFTAEPESDEMSDFEEDQDAESGAWSLDESSAGHSPRAPAPAVAVAKPAAVATWSARTTAPSWPSSARPQRRHRSSCTTHPHRRRSHVCDVDISC